MTSYAQQPAQANNGIKVDWSMTLGQLDLTQKQNLSLEFEGEQTGSILQTTKVDTKIIDSNLRVEKNRYFLNLGLSTDINADGRLDNLNQINDSRSMEYSNDSDISYDKQSLAVGYRVNNIIDIYAGLYRISTRTQDDLTQLDTIFSEDLGSYQQELKQNGGFVAGSFRIPYRNGSLKIDGRLVKMSAETDRAYPQPIAETITDYAEAWAMQGYKYSGEGWGTEFTLSWIGKINQNWRYLIEYQRQRQTYDFNDDINLTFRGIEGSGIYRQYENKVDGEIRQSSQTIRVGASYLF